MSKIAKNIKMLDILSNGKKYNCSQLAEKLEVSTRMVRQYKDELEKEGIYIETVYGKDGGYILKTKIETPLILFNENDVKLLDKLIKSSNKDDRKRIIELKEKITNYCNLVDNKLLNENDLEKFLQIKKAILDRKWITISYYGKEKLKERKIFPKQIYIANNIIMIIVLYSEDEKDIRHIKLDRIEKIIM